MVGLNFLINQSSSIAKLKIDAIEVQSLLDLFENLNLSKILNCKTRDFFLSKELSFQSLKYSSIFINERSYNTKALFPFVQIYKDEKLRG